MAALFPVRERHSGAAVARLAAAVVAVVGGRGARMLRHWVRIISSFFGQHVHCVPASWLCRGGESCRLRACGHALLCDLLRLRRKLAGTLQSVGVRKRLLSVSRSFERKFDARAGQPVGRDDAGRARARVAGPGRRGEARMAAPAQNGCAGPGALIAVAVGAAKAAWR